jgi:molybdenum cofactor cytidylyltransferase
VIPVVILAAGKSTRMGRPKALMPAGNGETFLSRIMRTFLEAGVDDIVVVLGHQAEAIVQAVEARSTTARFVLNPDYETGQLSSLLAGLAVVDRPGVQACLVTLVDVPFVTAATVRAVMERYREAHAPIVRPVSGSRHGHPVLIDRSLFPLLRAADPGAGAKPVIRAHASTAGDVPVDDDGAFLDIDTPADFERVADGGLNDHR